MKSQLYQNLERKADETNWKQIENYDLKESYSFDRLLEHFERWFDRVSKRNLGFTVESILPWPKTFLTLADTETLCLCMNSRPVRNLRKAYDLPKGLYERSADFPLKLEYEEAYEAGMGIMAYFKPSSTPKSRGAVTEIDLNNYWWTILYDDFERVSEITGFDITLDGTKDFIKNGRMRILASCLFSSLTLDLPSNRDYNYYMNARLYEDENSIKLLEEGKDLLAANVKAEIGIKLKGVLEDILKA